MIEFNNTQHGYTIASAAGVPFNPEVDVVISRSVGSNLLVGVILNEYTGSSINSHIAGFDPRWVSHDMIWVVFHYVFVQLGCSKMFGQVPSTNSKALEFDRKLGFKVEARIKEVFPDGDLIVLAMKKADCRWLRLKPRHLKEHV